VQSPEVGRRRQESLPDFNEFLGDEEQTLPMDQSGVDPGFELDPILKDQGMTSDSLPQNRDFSQPPEDSFDIGFDGSVSITRPSMANSSLHFSAFEETLMPDISAKPPQEADGAIRKLAKDQFAIFFQNLKAFQDLQRSNVLRAEDDITRIKSLLNEKADESTDCLTKLEQASQALDAAEAEQHDCEESCVKHAPLRVAGDVQNYDAKFLPLAAQTRELLDEIDQKAKDLATATEAAGTKLKSCKDTAQQLQQALDALRQELTVAKKVRVRCKNTSSVLQGSSDQLVSLSLGPQFPRDDDNDDDDQS